MDKRIRNYIKLALMIVFISVSYFAGITSVYAIEVVGSSTGLCVKTSNVLVPTDNLAPGDTETSSMTIYIDPESSIKTSSLPVWLRAEIVSNTPGRGNGDLDDKLHLTVTHDNGKKLYDGSISKFRKNISVGNVWKNVPATLTFTVHLPKSTGNEYQGASLMVKWIVTTQYVPSDDPTPTPTPRPPYRRPTPPPVVTVTPRPPEPSITVVPTITVVPSITGVPTEQPSITPTITPYDIEDEEIPGGPGDSEKEDDPEIIIIEEEEIPKGLPKTGELPPILFFTVGAGVVYVGMKLNKKKEK